MFAWRFIASYDECVWVYNRCKSKQHENKLRAYSHIWLNNDGSAHFTLSQLRNICILCVRMAMVTAYNQIYVGKHTICIHVTKWKMYAELSAFWAKLKSGYLMLIYIQLRKKERSLFLTLHWESIGNLCTFNHIIHSYAEALFATQTNHSNASKM